MNRHELKSPQICWRSSRRALNLSFVASTRFMFLQPLFGKKLIEKYLRTTRKNVEKFDAKDASKLAGSTNEIKRTHQTQIGMWSVSPVVYRPPATTDEQKPVSPATTTTTIATGGTNVDVLALRTSMIGVELYWSYIKFNLIFLCSFNWHLLHLFKCPGSGFLDSGVGSGMDGQVKAQTGRHFR